MTRLQNVPPPAIRRGIATLWTILALSVLVLLTCYVVEAGRLYLARQQLVTAVESAALAGATKWCRDASNETLSSRNAAIDFAAANLVLGQSPLLADNFSAAMSPNQNATCDGELVYGVFHQRTTEDVLDTTAAAGCGRRDGPNVVSSKATSVGDWQTITLCKRSYNCMVVVATPNYDDSYPPMVTRIRNAGGNSFEFFVQNVGTGAPIVGIPVNFIVAEAGVYNVGDHGAKMEVVKFESTITDNRASWVGQMRTYANVYTSPVIVGQVMTYNDPDWSVFWTRGRTRQLPATATNFYAGKSVAEDTDTTRANETLGYIVVEAGGGIMNGLPYLAGQTPDAVRGIATTFNQALPGNGAGAFAVLTQSGEAGGNGSWPLLRGADPVDPSQLTITLDEDQIRDNERNHTTEVVHYLVLGGPCAIEARATMEVPWLCENLFGCRLPRSTVSAEATAFHDCLEDCAKLICLDRVICP